jgi:quercetin dioxygenase-like cupin family protein
MLKRNNTMLFKRISPDFVITNPKGTLAQLCHEGWSQVNVLTSPAGSFRGNHYHKDNLECFYVVSGRLRVFFSTIDKSEADVQLFNEGDMFAIYPNIVHSLESVSDTVLVALYDKGVEKDTGEKDIWPVE